MKLILLLVLLCSCASDPWTKDQIYLQGIATTLKVIDWGQTLDIADKPDRYTEINPLIGEKPDRSRVNKYFACSAVSQVLITHLLPFKWRKYWIGSNIIISGILVGRSYSIGLRVNY